MSQGVITQLTALKTMPMAALKGRWRELFETEPPPYNRRFLESRLAYRIQELAYGSLTAETIARLNALAEQVGGGKARSGKALLHSRPITGTRLIREWNGIEHCVTVRDQDFEYCGKPYKSLSVIARQITGTRWNGWVFFGLKNMRGQNR